jgi:hypothetical protein
MAGMVRAPAPSDQGSASMTPRRASSGTASTLHPVRGHLLGDPLAVPGAEHRRPR